MQGLQQLSAKYLISTFEATGEQIHTARVKTLPRVMENMSETQLKGLGRLKGGMLMVGAHCLPNPRGDIMIQRFYRSRGLCG